MTRKQIPRLRFGLRCLVEKLIPVLAGIIGLTLTLQPAQSTPSVSQSQQWGASDQQAE